MIPSSAELQYFVEVANTLNISRAAGRLGISQPTLSLAVQRLEHSFGAPLLLRSKSGVRLTQAGQRLAQQARSLINDWEKLKKETLEAEDEVRGRYSIGCHPSVALYSLPHFLPGLIRQYPGLEVRVVHDLSRRITEEVIGFKIDFGIVVNPVRHPDLVIRQLCSDEVTFWTAPKASALQDPHSGEAVMICDMDLIQTQALLKQLGKKGWRFARTLTSGNLEVVASLVASGAGVGILPTRVATRVREQGLRPLKEAPVFTDKICLVYRSDLQKSHASRVISRVIEQALQNH